MHRSSSQLVRAQRIHPKMLQAPSSDWDSAITAVLTFYVKRNSKHQYLTDFLGVTVVSRSYFQGNYFDPAHFCSEFFEKKHQIGNYSNYIDLPSHISIELLAALVTFIYIKLANYTYPYFHSMSILIFSPACIANHLLTSYHSGNLEFSVPWISTG